MDGEQARARYCLSARFGIAHQAVALVVERLGPADSSRLRALSRLFGEVFEDAQTYGDAPPADDYLANLLAKPHVIVLVAETAGTLVGGLVAYELQKFERARSEIYLYDLGVAESHRRRGVATALIEQLGVIAAACGAWVVFVQADYGDDAAIALYQKLGVREDVMHFDIAVRAVGV